MQNTVIDAYPSFRMRPVLYRTVCLSSMSTTHLVPSSVSAMKHGETPRSVITQSHSLFDQSKRGI